MVRPAAGRKISFSQMRGVFARMTKEGAQMGSKDKNNRIKQRELDRVGGGLHLRVRLRVE